MTVIAVLNVHPVSCAGSISGRKVRADRKQVGGFSDPDVIPGEVFLARLKFKPVRKPIGPILNLDDPAARIVDLKAPRSSGVVSFLGKIQERKATVNR